jgi:hypothetical protein
MLLASCVLLVRFVGAAAALAAVLSRLAAGKSMSIALSPI